MEEDKCDNCKFKDSSAWMPPCFGCGYGYNNFESADQSGNNNSETAAAQLFAVCRFNNNSDKNCIVYNRQTISAMSLKV